MHPKEEKLRLRNAIHERLSHINEQERNVESRTLCKQVLHILPKEPINICVFYPLKDEVNIQLLISELIKQNCNIFLPCFEDNALMFRKMEDIRTLSPGAFKIPEPPKNAPKLDPQELSYALIPARAYTKDGKRLGRGNGGYDKWIRLQRAANPQTIFIGIALQAQIVENIPMEEHDERVDIVVTARGNITNT